MSNPHPDNGLIPADSSAHGTAARTVAGGYRPQSSEDYHADRDGPSLSSSIAHTLISRSPLHAWYAHPRLNPNYRAEESAEFDYGTAAHSMLLEGDESGLVIIEADDWRTKAAKEARDVARAAGKTPLLARQMAKVRAMVKAARDAVAASELAGVFEGAIAEHSIAWMDGDIRCKARPDLINDAMRVIVDYKTCANAEPDAFMRAGLSYGYDIQDAFYRRGMKALGKDYRFVFLAQEKEAPYVCSLVALDPAMQDMADRKVSFALASWQACLKANRWPGYPNRIAYIAPPAWYAAQAEELNANDMEIPL